jgi:hypothetical protein
MRLFRHYLYTLSAITLKVRFGVEFASFWQRRSRLWPGMNDMPLSQFLNAHAGIAEINPADHGIAGYRESVYSGAFRRPRLAEIHPKTDSAAIEP